MWIDTVKGDTMRLAEHAGLNRRFMESAGNLLSEWKIKDIIIVHDGSVLLSWHDRGSDRIGAIYSCTKSVLSALLGIAFGSGLIGGVQTPITDFFGELAEDPDKRKRGIRIEHLLTMTPGFDWPDFDKPYWSMKRKEDWIRFVLGRPMAHEPGEAFTYNSGGSHLLSAILSKAAGMPALSFAERELFGKLAFRKARWNGSGGISEGGAGLHLSARDMAKLGLLYLRRGRWNGKQLVPAGWVTDSTFMRHKGLQQYEPPIFGGYGYHWWVSPKEHNGCIDCYFAKGYGGQYIFVVPEADLVAVVRKEPEGKSLAIRSKQLLFDHIVPVMREIGLFG